MIKGISITLYDRVPTGQTDGFDVPIYTETPVTVENVLVAPVSSEDVIRQGDLEGKHGVIQLGIPKGDTHVWENRRIKIGTETFRTIGFCEEGIESLIPTAWHKKIKAERWNDG